MSQNLKNKIILEKISEYLICRFGEDVNIRECTLLDFQIRIGRQIPNPIETANEEAKKRVYRSRKVKKYLSIIKK